MLFGDAEKRLLKIYINEIINIFLKIRITKIFNWNLANMMLKNTNKKLYIFQMHQIAYKLSIRILYRSRIQAGRQRLANERRDRATTTNPGNVRCRIQAAFGAESRQRSVPNTSNVWTMSVKTSQRWRIQATLGAESRQRSVPNSVNVRCRIQATSGQWASRPGNVWSMSVESDGNAWPAIWGYKRTQRPIEGAGRGKLRGSVAAGHTETREVFENSWHYT